MAEEPKSAAEFTAQDLAIFKYHNGTGYVWADPFEICHKLQKFLGGRAEAVLRDFMSKDPDQALGAFPQVHHAVCVAFGFEPFNPETGTGTVFKVWNGALEEYLDFFRRLDAATVTSPTDAPPTELRLTSREDSPLPTTSDSGST
jgi:hypothetical protein